MYDIRNYDAAAHRFYSSQAITSLPLVSWDFHASHLQRIYRVSEDIALLQKLGQSNKWASLNELDGKLMQEANLVVVVTDIHLKIVHATQNIKEMNGYRPEEIIGKKPKMFQGPETSMTTSKNIGKAVREQKPFEAVVLNYRKDGSTYKCWIKGEPIYNISGEVVNFIAYEKEVA